MQDGRQQEHRQAVARGIDQQVLDLPGVRTFQPALIPILLARTIYSQGARAVL